MTVLSYDGGKGKDEDSGKAEVLPKLSTAIGFNQRKVRQTIFSLTHSSEFLVHFYF